MSSDGNLSLGEYLRQERERRGITLEQVASATKIGIRQLHSLESDQYSELPAKPFIRGFVNSYCRFVGLDSREVLTRFGAFVDQRSQDRPNRDAGHSGYAFERREGEQSRTILGAILVAFILLGGLAFVFLKQPLRQGRRGHADKLKVGQTLPSPLASQGGEELRTVPAASPTPPLEPVAVPAPKPTRKPAPSPAPAPVPAPTATATPKAEPSPKPDPLNSGTGLKPSEIKHKLVFKAQESVWVRYRVDDRPSMQFVLKKGKALVLRAKDQVVFQVANPKVVTLSYNNQSYIAVNQARSLVTRQNDATLIFPSELVEIIQEPFPGEKSLGTRPAPRVPTPEPSPSPSP